jgi:hypothetical protein
LGKCLLDNSSVHVEGEREKVIFASLPFIEEEKDGVSFASFLWGVLENGEAGR